MNKLKTIIVEDDRSIQSTIRSYVREFAPELMVVDVCRSVSNSVSAIRKHRPCLVFMDIEIIEGSGFDILKETDDQDYEVIFITGHAEYAIDALRANAIDYVLKPIVKSDFIHAMERFRLRMEKRKLMHQAPTLVIHGVHKITKVLVSDINYIVVKKGFCTFYLSDKRQINSPLPLSHYSIPDILFQVHRNYLVNIHMIQSIESGRGGDIRLLDGTTLPVAYRRKSELKMLWEAL